MIMIWWVYDGDENLYDHDVYNHVLIVNLFFMYRTFYILRNTHILLFDFYNFKAVYEVLSWDKNCLGCLNKILIYFLNVY